MQHVDFGVLDGLYHLLRDELDAVVDACKVLEGVEQQGCAGAEQVAGGGCDDGAVGQLNGGRRSIFLIAALLGGHGGAAVIGTDLGLLHKQGYLVDFAVGGFAVGVVAEGGVVAADNLVLGGLAADLVVADAKASHVDTHVGRRLVGVLTVDTVEDGVEHGEYLDVAVVVDGGLAIGFEVEGVDHVDVVEVGGGGLVGDVDGVLQRNAPDGEGLELGVAGLHAATVLVVELAEAYGHLAAAGTWGGDDHQRACGLDVVVLAEAVIGIDEFDVGGVALNNIMIVGLDAHAFETLAVGSGGGLAAVVGNDDAGDQEAALHEDLAQAQHVLVVGDAEVAAFLILLDVHGADDDDDFGIVFQLGEHLQLTVGLEAGQHTTGVVVVEQFTAKFKIKLIAELGDALFDVFGLYPQILLVVKPVFHIVVLLNFRG